MDENTCVANDFICRDNINIITGSNMSGKTSFMRAIGMNLILAYCGSFVNASEFNAPIMKIFTSINVKDDIGRGISTFYAELMRIRQILTFTQTNQMPVIVFMINF